MNVYLISPYGYCIGVQKAIDKAKGLLNEAKINNKNIYFEHALIHNEHVNKELESIYPYKIYNGEVLTKNDIFLISAHGHDYSIDENIEKADIRSAFCYLLEQRFKKIDEELTSGTELLYLGEKNHQETKATISYIELIKRKTVKVFTSLIDLIEYLKQAEEKNRLLIIQSTYNEEVKLSFPHLKIIEPCTFCTYRRTLLQENLNQYKSFVVVGSKTSSNSRSLYEVAKNGCENSYFVNSIEELNEANLIEPVCVCSGTSADKKLVEEIVDYIKSL